MFYFHGLKLARNNMPQNHGQSFTFNSELREAVICQPLHMGAK
jgi:hypothetical protein